MSTHKQQGQVVRLATCPFLSLKNRKLNAGFNNYSEYAFKQKNRDYSIEDCFKFHESIEKCVVSIWKQLGSFLKKNLDVKTYRPWDLAPCNLQKYPLENYIDLLDGIEEKLRKTHSCF
ncbi:peptidase M3, partial [Bacillus thuringiensis]|nr:peptidase M3 [Bacillus thuringiensis]